MSVCSTGDVTIKPLIICGGCSFTHSPDSWAQVLGNYRTLWNNTAQQNHNNWKKYGKEICNANLDHIPNNIYDVWDQGTDISKLADVMVVGQGASGNELNSRVIRKAIEMNHGRKIIVLWQLSGWNRKEYAINKYGSLNFDEIYNEPGTRHMYSITDAKRFRNVSHLDGQDHEIPSAVGHRLNEEFNVDDAPEITPPEYMSSERMWLKGGGTYSGWEGSVLYDFFKQEALDLNTDDNQSVKNLEAIEYTKLFCEAHNVQLLMFPGWYWCWEGQFRLGDIHTTLLSKEVLNRLTLEAVDNIDGSGGIAEWGLQHEEYVNENTSHHNPNISLKSGYVFHGNETSSIYEKALTDDGEWWCGNHPSAYIHAKFCNEWIKPRINTMLDKITK